MLLRVLGPLEVTGPDGPVVLGGTKPRTLLAALAVKRGRVCSIDDLIDAVWGEAPPVSAPKLLQVYVSQLRRVLPAGIAIRTATPGYALEVDAAEVDSAVFERHLGEGRAASRAGNPALAASTLARGLVLWRGPAYADVRYEAFAQVEIERLERSREAALRDRIDADLQLGRHAEILGELRGLLADDPTDESVAFRTMLAAHRSGSPAEALAIFDTLRSAMLADLVSEPGPELVELRDRIERRDPDLAAAPSDRTDPAARLPMAPNPLVGRQSELAELRALLDRPDVRLVSCTGAGGSGKSRLVLELAHEISARYANGAVLVDLSSLADPDLVPATIAWALGLDPGVDAMATLIEALANREMLLVLDDIEHLRAVATDLVRLLAAAPRLVIVATTRVVLHVSGEHVYPVAPLAVDDAVALFIERAQALDRSFRSSPTAERTIAAICRRVDCLPLPIELAAARVHVLGLTALDARLASRLTVLTGGPRDLPARQQTLRETLDWSANLLEPDVRDALAALAVFPGSFALDAATAVAGADDGTLGTLVDHHLIEPFTSTVERRFRLLETVREYAGEALGERRGTIEDALIDWVVGLVGGLRFDGLNVPPTSAFDRLATELDNVRLALRRAAEDPDPTRELALASGIWRFWLIRGHLAEGRVICDGIVARRGIVRSEAGVRTALGGASFAWTMGDDVRAEAVARAVVDVARDIGDVIDEASAHNLIAILAQQHGDLAGAERSYTEGIRLATSIGEGKLALMMEMNLANVDIGAGRTDAARQRLRAVLAAWAPEGRSEGVGYVQVGLGETEFAAGDLEAARGHFEAAADAFRSIGFSSQVAIAEAGLAAVEARTGQSEAAAVRLGAASRLLAEAGWQAKERGLAGLAEASAREQLGDPTFERLFGEGASTDDPVAGGAAADGDALG